MKIAEAPLSSSRGVRRSRTRAAGEGLASRPGLRQSGRVRQPRRLPGTPPLHHPHPPLSRGLASLGPGADSREPPGEPPGGGLRTGGGRLTKGDPAHVREEAGDLCLLQ
ncbi:MAG: hypothetical protein MZV70_22280 [Desulfobacterales bacterium]|nr:hypothetical protein [Desulfobacterales bacterium]